MTISSPGPGPGLNPSPTEPTQPARPAYAPTPAPPTAAPRFRRIAFLGNPNTGKTTLFNRLTGLRHKTSNFPGTTLDARVGRMNTVDAGLLRDALAGARGDCCGQPDPAAPDPGTASTAPFSTDTEIIDLPGVYSLELDILESRVAREALAGTAASGAATLSTIKSGGQLGAEPDAICVVADATNLARNLRLVGEALRRRLPTVVAVNMIDIARKRGLRIDVANLQASLGCQVLLVSARTGEGLNALRAALLTATIPTRTPPGGTAGAEEERALAAWADDIFARCATADIPEGASPQDLAAAQRAATHRARADARTDRVDQIVLHPLWGGIIFGLLMLGVFYTIFSLATIPMDLLDKVFGTLAAGIHTALGDGLFASVLADGVVVGIGATVIFIPQICLLFFLISLLEDSGYLARGALLTDRLLRPFGLPGHAFVPLLSAHACALPAIMSCRAIPDPKQRLATILVSPFMSCSARIPVYALLTTLLFPGRPGLAALAFVGCYLLGMLAAVLSSLIARRTILRGRARPLAIELPSYKMPSLRTALTTTVERAFLFAKNAGTNILAVSLVLWWLGAFPQLPKPATLIEREQVVALAAESFDAAKAATPTDAQAIESAQSALDTAGQELAPLAAAHAREAKSQSYVGRLGKLAAPIFEPIGCDWRLTVGVLASFAAREVFSSTMAVVVAGEVADAGDIAENAGIRDRLATATRDDGKTLVFNPATNWSILVFFVLAMQCLPTLVITARETGHPKWALLQLVWMSGLAYGAAFAVHTLCLALGVV